MSTHAIPWRASGTVVFLYVLLTVSCSPAPGADLTAGDLITRPTAYVGQSLTVSGNVEDIYGPRAFTIDSGMQDGDLLVLSAEPLPQLAEIDNGQGSPRSPHTAVVTGIVRLFVASEIERELGWDVGPELEAEFKTKSALISRTTTFTPK